MEEARREGATFASELPEVEHDRLVKALTAERFRPLPRRRHHVVTAAGGRPPADEQRRAG